MAEKQNLVEEALIQMKSLENVVAENAKGILASTMKEEISELVKESLKTEEDSELDLTSMEVDEQLDTDMVDVDDEESDDNEMDTDDMEDDMDDMADMSSDDDEFDFTSMNMDDEEPIDLTMASDEEILKVFKAMGEEDGIIVKRDGDTIDLEDTNEDVEYKISLGEQMEEDMDEEMEEDMDEELEEEFEEDESEVMFEIEMDDNDMDDFQEISMDDDDDEFEINFDDFEDLENSDDESDEEFEFKGDWNENADMKKSETKEGFKPKGTGMGKPKFSYEKQKGGFSEGEKVEAKEGSMKMKPKGMGMGKPKFEYKEGEKMNMKKPMKKEGETSEASRTLANGKRWGRQGLDKPKAAPRHLKVENVEKELTVLRERNEEYRKALNIFRGKLNEVAVFNSNLAYATRLFTEHSTTKNEKINILRRFDSVESLKESKSLYKTIKDELSSQGSATVVKESLQEKMERTPSSGSATNLIESKTYENPQFSRMRDLMSKINIIK